MARKLPCVAHHAVIPNQFIIVPGAIIGNSVWRASIMPARTKFCLFLMRQTMRELLNIADMLAIYALVALFDRVLMVWHKNLFSMKIARDAKVRVLMIVLTYNDVKIYQMGYSNALY